MFGRRFFSGSYYGPRYFGDGGDILVVAETPSGGWSRRHSAPFRTETESEREARIHAERVRMRILPPDPSELDAGEVPSGLAPGLSTPLSTTGPGLSTLGTLAAHLLPEDLARLEALAARAAELTIDAEIAFWLKLDEQRRLHEAWLRDEDDAAVLLLAIATTIH